MKRVAAMILNLIGGLLILLGVAMVLLQISQWSQWGIVDSERNTVLFILFAFVGGGIFLCILGIHIYKNTKKIEVDEWKLSYQRKIPTFSDGEYNKEQAKKEASPLDYVSGSGTYIWKYRGRKSSGLLFHFTINGGILGCVVLAFVCVILMVFLNQYLEDYVGRQASMWIQSSFILVLALVLGIGAMHIGRKGNSMQLAFAKNEESVLYVFDYRSWAFQDYLRSKTYSSMGISPIGQMASIFGSFWNNFWVGKQIERIEKEQILERIMKSGRIAPYGRKVVSVKNIEQKKTYCQIYCSLRNLDGTLDDTRLILSNEYDHFDELIYWLQLIQWNSAFDRKRSVSKYEKYRPLIRVLDVVMPILCVICLAGCIISRVYNEKATYEYQKVKVDIVSCTSDVGGFSASQKPTVTVSYYGTEYPLHNVVQGSWFYNTRRQIEAYLADGKMFANEEGVKSTRMSGIVYFVFLFALIFLVTALGVEKAMKKDIVMKSGDWEKGFLNSYKDSSKI